MAIPNSTITMHHVGNVVENINMSMRAEDFPHIAELLNSLYAEPIVAIVREYSTNAWDSHVSAGVTRPIEITLPTTDRLELVIQDFGLGMSIDDLRNTYSMYGASSKRLSNAVAGQLGLGCKSGLSYAEAFTITAIKDGIKTVAMSTKDDHGIGVIKVLDTAGTTEGNGVRINIPIQRYDVAKVCDAAYKLFQFWSPDTVLINGSTPITPDWAIAPLRIDNDTLVVRSDGSLNTSYVIMGNVPYPVKDAKVGRSNRRFVARINIGDVDFVPSREAVKHTRHTDATLSELSEYITDNFDRVLKTKLGTATNKWEETLLGILWSGKTLALESNQDRYIISYNPEHGARRKSQSHAKYNLYNITQSNVIVVTGFNAKTLSAPARSRLEEYAPKDTRFVILPAGVSGIGMLQGRPGTVAWETIVGSTNKVKVKGVARSRKTETVYQILDGGGMTAAELSSLTGKVMYLEPDDTARYGSLDGTVVRLYSTRQLQRIRRAVPNIVHYPVELQARQDEALEAITSYDISVAQARTLDSVFASLPAERVEDPELAKHIRLSKVADTDTIADANRLGITVRFSEITDYRRRYQLINPYGQPANLSTTYKEDCLLYINTKYNNTILLNNPLQVKGAA